MNLTLAKGHGSTALGPKPVHFWKKYRIHESEVPASCSPKKSLCGRGVSPRGGRECPFLPTETWPYTDTLANKNEALSTVPWLQLSIITRDIFSAPE